MLTGTTGMAIMHMQITGTPITATLPLITKLEFVLEW